MLKRYDSYKSWGIQWIGEIPEHWNLKRIKHTTYVKGRIGWQGLRSDEFLEVGDSYVVTGTDFSDGRINWETCYQITQSRYDEDPFIQLRENDLLITKDGTIGKIALVKNIPSIATLNSGIFVTRPKTVDYITEFMFWVLQSDVFTSFINHNKSGSTILHLYQNVFNEFKFPCPPLEEQTRIAKYLDYKSSQIDKLITDKEKLIELMYEERTAIINQVVTKGLNFDVSLKDSGIDWLGQVPERWEVIPIKRIVEVRDGTHDTPEYVNDDRKSYPLVTSKDFEGEDINFEGAKMISEDDYFSISKRSGVKNGDILMSMIGGNIGKSLIVGERDHFAIKNLALFMTRGNTQMAKYLRYYFESGLLHRQIELKSRGGAQGFLSLGDIRNLVFFKFDVEELKSINSFLDEKVSGIHNITANIRQEIQLLKEYKTALISEVVTGKVDVRDEIIAESPELVT